MFLIVVACDMSKRLSDKLAPNALKQVIGLREVEIGPIFHNDQGIQFASNDIRKILKDHEVTPGHRSIIKRRLTLKKRGHNLNSMFVKMGEYRYGKSG